MRTRILSRAWSIVSFQLISKMVRIKAWSELLNFRYRICDLWCIQRTCLPDPLLQAWILPGLLESCWCARRNNFAAGCLVLWTYVLYFGVSHTLREICMQSLNSFIEVFCDMNTPFVFFNCTCCVTFLSNSKEMCKPFVFINECQKLLVSVYATG